MAEIRAHLRIHGLVQGVFYRASARRQAQALGLRGFARNCDDGSVEIIAEGDEAAIDELVAWCRVGPRDAQVTNLEIERGPTTGEFGGFSVG